MTCKSAFVFYLHPASVHFFTQQTNISWVPTWIVHGAKHWVHSGELLSPSWEIRKDFAVGVASKPRREAAVDVIQAKWEGWEHSRQTKFLSLNYPNGPEK